MNQLEQILEAITILKEIANKSTDRRIREGRGEWALSVDDRIEVIDFVSELTEDESVIENVENLLSKLERVHSSPLTVLKLENELRKIADDLTVDAIDAILDNISDEGERILIASRQMKEAINDINNLRKVFGSLSIFANLFTALSPALFAGNFASLLNVAEVLIGTIKPNS